MTATPIRAAFWAATLLLAAPSAQAQEAPNLAAMVEAWAASGHADTTAEAFAHWNAEGEVPGACAVCHAGAGFRDYHGIDGSTAGQVDATIPTGGVVDCDTCHAPGSRRSRRSPSPPAPSCPRFRMPRPA